MRFSERYGYGPRKALQTEEMDGELRVSLWNAFYEGCLLELIGNTLRTFLRTIWSVFFKQPLDNVERLSDEEVFGFIKSRFSDMPWHGVYDVFEFAVESIHFTHAAKLRKCCNEALERENSGYRLVDAQVTPITSAVEIEAIEEAIKDSSPFAGAHAHLKQALSLFSDRKEPDYRNCIKESISAVESLSKVIIGNDKATLGEALKEIGKHISIHGALKDAFTKLYGWTSDEGGIRHALMDEDTVSFSDAKFMLVACSAFVNYLLGKASESGLALGTH